MEIIDNIQHIDIKKIQHKAIKVLVGFICGYFAVNMATKFVQDNYTFRIPRISNKPADMEENKKD